MAEPPVASLPRHQRGAAGPLWRAGAVQLALLWLGGFDLRVTILAVPPVIPAIHRDLGLDETMISVLTGLPVLLLGVAAIPGSLLIARAGVRRALLGGLVAIGAGSLLRGVGPSLVLLLAMTAVMGAGVAVSQPAFPTLTREWFPNRVALATAVYSNGLLVGETLPASLTGPVIAPALAGSWPLTFATWSLPAFLGALLVARLTREEPRRADLLMRRWWPDFGDHQMLRVGMVMGFASAVYFGTNAFLPDFTRAIGRPGLKDPTLTALNASQLLASFAVLALSGRLTGRRWPFAVAGAIICAAGLSIVVTAGAGIVFWAGAIGFASALALVLTLALPPLLVAPADVPRFSAGIFLIMYVSSFAGPLLGGAAWDVSARPAAAFLTLAACGVLMLVVIARSDLRRRA
ncbi:MAG TPA: MFS transporter [Candidatus Dormibacteraeota bacterium]|nr:MFS transporter [Candidatus Dormibacteraeota bacterium]